MALNPRGCGRLFVENVSVHLRAAGRRRGGWWGPCDASCLPKAQLPISHLPGLWGQGRPCMYTDASGMEFLGFFLTLYFEQFQTCRKVAQTAQKFLCTTHLVSPSVDAFRYLAWPRVASTARDLTCAASVCRLVLDAATGLVHASLGVSFTSSSCPTCCPAQDPVWHVLNRLVFASSLWQSLFPCWLWPGCFWRMSVPHLGLWCCLLIRLSFTFLFKKSVEVMSPQGITPWGIWCLLHVSYWER